MKKQVITQDHYPYRVSDTIWNGNSLVDSLWAIVSYTETTNSSGSQEWLLLSPYSSIPLQHCLAYVNHRKHWFAVSLITTKIWVNKMGRKLEGNMAQWAGRGSKTWRQSVHSTFFFDLSITSPHSRRLCTVRLLNLPAYM
jgi:hypothetical protein